MASTGPQAQIGQLHFAERLWPGVGMWLFALALSATAGLVFYPAGGWPAVLLAGAGAAGIAGALFAWWSPRVRVVDVLQSDPGDGTDEATEAREEPSPQRWLQAGRARIPVAALGHARVLDREQWRQALGPAMDARSHRLVRGWITTGVTVEVTDARDPVPYWLVSSRRPAELCRVLRAESRAF